MMTNAHTQHTDDGLHVTLTGPLYLTELATVERITLDSDCLPELRAVVRAYCEDY